jgi:hypothetical protein
MKGSTIAVLWFGRHWRDACGERREESERERKYFEEGGRMTKPPSTKCRGVLF